jgi:adenylate kinase family enzyme
MKRVMIIGGAGAGKSTLARRLGSSTGLPVVHIDPMYWQPGWIQRDVEETRRLVRAAARSDSWNFDGNNASTFQDRLERADTLIFLDMSTLCRLWRVLRRIVLGYGNVRSDQQTDCPERFDFAFIRWVAAYSRNGRHKALALLRTAPAHIDVYHFRRPAEVDRYLREVQEVRQSRRPLRIA